MKMNELIRKGQKTVAQYMRRSGYQLYDCVETETGYTAEYYYTAAGITLRRVYVYFTKNWRVAEIKEEK